MSGWSALYIFMLAAFTGYVVIGAVPVILHTPLMSGANFVHGIVLVGAMVTLGFARTPLEVAIGVIAVVLATLNVHGGFVVTVRMLAMFKSSRERGAGKGDRLGAGTGDARDADTRGADADTRAAPGDAMTPVDDVIKASYFATAVLFIAGLRSMSSPATARRGIVWAGVGMTVAAAATFFTPGLHHIRPHDRRDRGRHGARPVVGPARADDRHAADDRPLQRHGRRRGGGHRRRRAHQGRGGRRRPPPGRRRHPGRRRRPHRRGLVRRQPDRLRQAAGARQAGLNFPAQNVVDLAVLAVAVAGGVLVVLGETGVATHYGTPLVLGFIGVALVFGVLMTLPIGGADMPVVICLYNALTGLAVAFEGYVLANPAMIIAGMVVGAAGTMLTQLMARAMNRSLANVLFSGFGAAPAGGERPRAAALAPIEAERRRHHARLRRQGHRRAGLRHGGGPGPAQGLGARPAPDRPRRAGQVRDPPGGRAHARPHERAARRGRRALRLHLRPRRHQPRVRHGRRGPRDRRERHREPLGQDRSGEPDLRHADPRRGPGRQRRRDQARRAAPASPASRTRSSSKTTCACSTATARRPSPS